MKVADRSLKVLIVEDELVAQKVMRKILGDRGHEVEVYGDAESALSAYRKVRYPLVLLDWLLPDMDGIELCKKMRQLPHGDRSVILMVTSCDKPEDLRTALDAGADDYLTKPVDIDLLGVRLTIAERQIENINEHKRLEREIIEVGTDEQRRIGQDIHDSLGQVLTGITFMTKALERKLSAKTLPEAKDAAKIEELVHDALGRTQHLAKGLYPVELSAEGLTAAIQDLAATTETVFGIQCQFEYDESIQLDDEAVATHLYRIAQEAINNAVKHAGATNIRARLLRQGGEVVLTVEDDGKGVDRNGGAGGLGLNIMRYRAHTIDASLNLDHGSDGGTLVTCTLGNKR